MPKTIRWTVNRIALLLKPVDVETTTLPVVAPAGMAAVIEFALQLVGVAVMPLKVRLPDACESPKLMPEMLTTAPTNPIAGEMLVIIGCGLITVRRAEVVAVL